MSFVGFRRGVRGGASIVNAKDFSGYDNISQGNASSRQRRKLKEEVNGNEHLDAKDLALLVELDEKIPESWVDVEDPRLTPISKQHIKDMIDSSSYRNERGVAPAVNDEVRDLLDGGNFTVDAVGVQRPIRIGGFQPWIEGCFVQVKMRDSEKIVSLASLERRQDLDL